MSNIDYSGNWSSPGSQYAPSMQLTGNFVLVENGVPTTDKTHGSRVVIQSDGILVMYDH